MSKKKKVTDKEKLRRLRLQLRREKALAYFHLCCRLGDPYEGPYKKEFEERWGSL